MRKGVLFLLSLLTLSLGASLTPKEEACFSPAKAVTETTYNLGTLSPNFNAGTNSVSVNGSGQPYVLYFKAESNGAPFNSDWSLRYKATATSNLTIIRKDGTIIENAATNTAGEIIGKYSETDYFLCLESWLMNKGTPNFGDKLIVKGNFARESNGVRDIIHIDETMFYFSGTSSTECTAYPEPIRLVDMNAMATDIDIPSYPGKTWHFLIWAWGVSEQDVPITGDSNSYRALDKGDIYIDGQPSAKVGKEAFRRRDFEPDDQGINTNYEFYVVNQSSGQNFNLSVGQTVTFDGMFMLDVFGNNTAIKFSLVTFQRTGTGENDYKKIDLKAQLIEKANEQFDPYLYSEDDRPAIMRLLNELAEVVNAAYDCESLYAAYDAKVAEFGEYEYDPEAAEEYIRQERLKTIEAGRSYINFDNYFEEELNVINQALETFITNVNNATKKTELDELLLNFRAFIDSVKVKREVMTDAIENQKPGFDKYLKTYDTVSLSALNLKELTFHGRLNERNNDFNTNVQETNLNSSFIPSPGNEKGNVIFQFNYVPNATPLSGGNMMIVLRGIPYYGYKFAIDTSGRGCYLEVLDPSQSYWRPGSGDGIFTDGQLHKVKVGAIDLIDCNLTWTFVMVNNDLKLNYVVDSLDICQNPRIGLCPNGDYSDYNDYEGTATITSWDDNISDIEGQLVDLFEYDPGHSDAKANIYFKLEENKLPYSSDKSLVYYPLSTSAVQLERGGYIEDIADPTIGTIAKYGIRDYQLFISRLIEVQNGDRVIIDGTFAAFYDSTKIAFTTLKCSFIYSSSNNSWELYLTLDDAKNNARKTFENLVDIFLYDVEEQTIIRGIIESALVDVDNATSVEAVNEIVNRVKQSVKEQKTSFMKVQDSAIMFVQSYKIDELDNYLEQEQNDIALMRADAIDYILEATTQEEIDAILESFKADVDNLTTKAEYEAIWLSEAIVEGVQKIQDCYGALDLSKYTKDEIESINLETKQAIENIKKSTKVEDVNRIVDEYLNKYAQKQNPSQGGNKVNVTLIIVLVVVGVLLTGGALLAVLLIKKFKKKKVN